MIYHSVSPVIFGCNFELLLFVLLYIRLGPYIRLVGLCVLCTIFRFNVQTCLSIECILYTLSLMNVSLLMFMCHLSICVCCRSSWLIDCKRMASKIKNASGPTHHISHAWKSNPTKECPKCNHIINNSDVRMLHF